MAKQTYNIHDEPAEVWEFTRKIEAMGASSEVVAEVFRHAYQIKTETAAMVLKQCNNGPVTMVDFAEELNAMRRRAQAMGVAMLGLTLEHKDDGYVEGVHQMVLDLENNARRLETMFDTLLPRTSN